MRRRQRRWQRDEFVGQVVCEYAWRAIAVPGRAAAEDLGLPGLFETAGSPSAHTHERARDPCVRPRASAGARLNPRERAVIHARRLYHPTARCVNV